MIATSLVVMALLGPAASPRETVASMFAAFNRHDAKGMAALYADDARLTSSDFCAPRGRADVTRTYQALFSTFPDIRDDPQIVVVQGDWVAVRFLAHSPRDGFQLRISSFIRVRGGLIVEDHSDFDNGGRPCEP